jgi:hypothetical protein
MVIQFLVRSKCLISTDVNTQCILSFVIRFTTMTGHFFTISIIHYELWSILTTLYQWCSYTNNNKPIKYSPNNHANVTTH